MVYVSPTSTGWALLSCKWLHMGAMLTPQYTASTVSVACSRLLLVCIQAVIPQHTARASVDRNLHLYFPPPGTIIPVGYLPS